MQYLPTATSVFATFSVWVSENLETLHTLYSSAETEEERQAYENAIDLFQDSPVMASFAVDSSVMKRDIVIEEVDESIDTFDNSDVTIPSFDYDEPVINEEDNCDCPACQMRRAIEESLNRDKGADTDTKDEDDEGTKLSGLDFIKVLAALANAKR